MPNDFYQNWTSYEKGFGCGDGYWAGLAKVHELTKNNDYYLNISLEVFNGNTKYAVYRTFIVKGFKDIYKLTIENYSGTAGNSMDLSVSLGFKTPAYDYTNDNCVQEYHSSWWHEHTCTRANLNGKMLSYRDNRKHVFWYTFNNDYTPLRSCEMRLILK